jgi:hypothetical protein
VKHAFHSGDYRVTENTFQQILHVADLQHFRPEIDAFSSRAHRRLQNYWSCTFRRLPEMLDGQNSMDKSPLRHLPKIVEKIFTIRPREYSWCL